ncbi:MAG TPA: arabinan endo-1,5-alpha-L-arabinosidase [Fimbriimonadaceae bacterium]|nr:arabinan endo-1,5-alpha-L-arabinosidase [Fimbriimonadaceae bacterium]
MIGFAIPLIVGSMVDNVLEPHKLEAVSFDSGEIFPGDGSVSVNAENVHDPTIIEFKGRYFCFSTSGNGFGVVRSSRDLKEWKIWGPILAEQPEWLKERYSHRSVWAPDVVVLGDKLRVYYSVSNWGTNKSVIGLAECDGFDPDHPLNGWRDLGLVIESEPDHDTFNAIDPELRIDGEGRHWLFFGSYFAGIFTVEVDPATGKLKNPEQPAPILVAKNTSERGNPLEGAAVCHRKDYYYLFVSYGLAGQGIRSTYRIMVGRSKSIAGPYVDAEGKAMTEGGHVNVLKTSPPMISPGHCDVLQESSGRWLMPYHFYDSRRIWHGDLWGKPMLQVRELLWSADGWPMPGLPVEFRLKGHSHTSPVGKWIHQADFGQPETIDLKADGTIGGAQTTGRWEADASGLVLKWARADEPGQFWIDHVQLAYGGRYYVGRNAQGMVIRGIRADQREGGP